MKQLSLLTAFMMIAFLAGAQNKTANSLQYKTAIGVKLWNGGGVTLKTFVKDNQALELIGFLNSAGTRITGLYEFHGDLNTEGNLKWYLGFGAHAGLYKLNNTLFGGDGVVGMDYKFKDMPLNLALDWQPTVEFKKNYGFTGNWGGLAIRYTL